MAKLKKPLKILKAFPDKTLQYDFIYVLCTQFLKFLYRNIINAVATCSMKFHSSWSCAQQIFFNCSRKFFLFYLVASRQLTLLCCGVTLDTWSNVCGSSTVPFLFPYHFWFFPFFFSFSNVCPSDMIKYVCMYKQTDSLKPNVYW